MKKQTTKITSTIKPNPEIFNHSGVGRKGFKPLKHKEDGSNFTDIEYFELLGKRIEELDKNNSGILPVNYEKYGYDRDTVKVAKQVLQAKQEGRPDSEIKEFLSLCIDFSK